MNQKIYKQKTSFLKKTSFVFFIVLISFFLIFIVAKAGTLSPSASPAGTMNTLESIYNSIAGTFNSSAISASSTGSLIQNLKYIASNLSWASSSNNIYNLNSGYIGIGTSTPSYALDASGTIQMTGFRLPTGATNNYVLTSNANGAGTWQAAAGGASGSGAANYLAKFTATSTLATSTIIESSSSIAIGTSTPVSLFEIYSTTSTQLTITSATSSDSILGFRTGATPVTKFLFGVDQSDSNKFKIATSTIGTNDILIINQAGQVGINNASPTDKLTVTGNIANVASTSFNPVLKSTTLSASGGEPEPFAIMVVGKYAYVVNSGNATMEIFDVSNPSAPTSTSITVIGALPENIYVAGRYAYITNTNSNTLQILDISNPKSPSSVGSISTDTKPVGLQVSGKYAYVNNFSSSTLQIFDVSNPASPSMVSRTTLAYRPYTYGLYVQGRYAYSLSSSTPPVSKFQIIDVSNPASPVIVSSTNTTSTLGTAIAVSGRYAYIGHLVGYCPPGSLIGCSAVIQIFDVSNPASPQHAGSFTTDASAVAVMNMQISGRYLFLAMYGDSGDCTVTAVHPGTLEIYDLVNPTSPVKVGSVQSPCNQFTYVAGRYAYTADYVSSNLRIFDISGLETTSAMIHSLEAGSLQTQENVFIANNLSVGGGINIGAGGLFSAGDVGIRGTLMVNGTSTANIILAGPGNDTVSTSTSPGLRRTTTADFAIDSPAGIIMNIDTDNNGTTSLFAVKSNASSTNLFSVNELGKATVFSAASSTLYLGSASLSACYAIGDTDNAGLTYVTVLNGVLSATTTKPSVCQ